MSQPQPWASGPAPVPPFAAMFRGALLPTGCAAPVVVLVFWISRQNRGGWAALLGVTIAVAFFASGPYVMGRVTNASPISFLAGALAVYLGQVSLLGMVMLALSGAAWLDGQAFGLSVLAVALIWQVSLVVALLRLRQPLYDVAPDGSPGGSPDGSAGRPEDRLADRPADEPVRRRLR